jgi:general secretion pathway protein A
MDYFTILNLKKEPFSNSPDPEFFFHSRQHLDCLQKLELSLLLRRGLNVIIGDVGTGKTTMCRQLIRRFSQKDEVETHLILDPYFLNASEFLATVTEMFTGKKPPPGSHDWQAKEQIKQHLFSKGVDENKTITLIIDEGQKIPVFCLEILREFLNYETNEFKLLQIVIFAQKEFESTIRKYPNFADRISLYHQLRPLNFRDTRLMIKYRLEKSNNSAKKLHLFTSQALWAVYRSTGGYPRKIINLCHHCILSMIIQNRSKIGYFLVNTCARRVFPEQSQKKRRLRAAAAAAAVIAAALLILQSSDLLRALQSGGIQSLKTLFSQKSNQKIILPVPKQAPRTYSAHIAASDFPDLNRSESDLELLLKKEVPAQTAAALNEKSLEDITPGENKSDTTIDRAPMTVEQSAGEERDQKAEKQAPVPESADKTPPAASAAPTFESTYATILGQLTLQRNETLSRIIQLVYGAYSSRYFKSFIMANPDIEDPDRVEVGQIVALPAIPVRVKPPEMPVWWVKIDEKDSLEAAFNILRSLPDGLPTMRLIPHWNPSDGTKFALILNEAFKDEQTARTKLQKIPAGISSNPTLMSWWDKGTVYFANPYLNLKN